MTSNYRIQITIDGTRYPIRRDVAHCHPEIVHDAMGTNSEVELQAALDGANVEDWYGADGQHLGPGVAGVEMFREPQQETIYGHGKYW